MYIFLKSRLCCFTGNLFSVPLYHFFYNSICGNNLKKDIKADHVIISSYFEFFNTIF